MSRIAAASLLACLLLAPACGGGDDDGPPGGDPDAGDDPADAGDLAPAVAAPGERCDPVDRIGIVHFSVGKIVTANIYDRRDPFLAEPALEDDTCAFHEFAPESPCPPCDFPDVCSVEGACVESPLRDTAARLVVRAGGDEQTFEADETTGDLGGEITLPGDSFAFEVEFYGQIVTLEEELSVPDPLDGFSAMLVGTYDAPEAVEAAWDPAPEGTHLFTRVPINHHAGAPTFTECAFAGDAGEASIPEGMLVPLAVATGLEFQGFDHVRFAAAETSRGCVEVRFLNTQSVGLDGV